MKHIFLITFLILTAAAGSYAQQADTTKYNFTVADCVNYAYQHQHDVVNAKLDVQSAQYHVKEIIGQGYPQISASASFQDYLKAPVVIFPNIIGPAIFPILNAENVVNSATGKVISANAPAFASGSSSFSIYQKYNANDGINVSQILFDPSYIVGLQGRKTYQQLYDRSYTRSKIETNVSVTKAYYQVLVSIEQLRLLQANIDALKQQLDETTARNKQGFVEKIDVDRITVQYNSLVTTRENTIRSIVLEYEMLKFQMGMPVEGQLKLKDKLEDIQLDPSAADAQKNDTTVYQRRIEYGLLETQEKLDEYDLKLKKGAFLPKLTANGVFSDTYQNNSIGDLFKPVYPLSYVGLSLSVPLFTGWQHQNQYKESRINLLKSQNDMVNMKNTINLQVEQARIYFINGIQTLNDQKKNMALAEEVLHVSKVKYEQGVGSSLEVTQAQNDLTQADNTYIQGLYDALVSKVDLDKAYGRIQ